MPTVISHPAVPLAIGWGLGARIISPPLLVTGMLLSVLPDADVMAFRWGIPYAAEFGHRGFSHSLPFALLVALIGAICARWLRTTFSVAFAFLFLAAASHGLLDAITTGGLGVALLWPFAEQRFFAPLRVIEVSPLGVARFFSLRGTAVILSELRWVWGPCFVVGCTLVAGRLMAKRARNMRPRTRTI